MSTPKKPRFDAPPTRGATHESSESYADKWTNLGVSSKVVLYYKGRPVRVRVLAARDGGKFIGEIAGFLEPEAFSHDDLRAGDRVEFDAQDVAWID